MGKQIARSRAIIDDLMKEYRMDDVMRKYRVTDRMIARCIAEFPEARIHAELFQYTMKGSRLSRFQQVNRSTSSSQASLLTKNQATCSSLSMTAAIRKMDLALPLYIVITDMEIGKPDMSLEQVRKLAATVRQEFAAKSLEETRQKAMQKS